MQHSFFTCIFFHFFLFLLFLSLPSPIIKIFIDHFLLNLLNNLFFILLFLFFDYDPFSLLIQHYISFQQLHSVLVLFALQMIFYDSLSFKFFFTWLACKLINNHLLKNTVFLIFLNLLSQLLSIFLQSLSLKLLPFLTSIF